MYVYELVRILIKKISNPSFNIYEYTIQYTVGWSDFERKKVTHSVLGQFVVGQQFQNITLKVAF